MGLSCCVGSVQNMAAIASVLFCLFLITTNHEVRAKEETEGSGVDPPKLFTPELKENLTKTDVSQNKTSSEPTKPKDDSVVLITGGSHISVFQTVEVLDPLSTGCHPSFSPLPTHTMFGHTSHFVAPDKVFLVGGDTTEKGKHCLILEHMGGSLMFHKHSTLHTPRSFHQGVVLGHNIWIFGGVNAVDKTESLNGTRWVEQKVEAGKRSSCSVALDNTTMVATGGAEVWSTGEVNMLDIETGEWTPLEAMKTGRMNHGCVFLEDSGSILVAGGQKTSKTEEDVYLRSSEIYDIKTGKWAPVGDLVEARSHGQMVEVGGRVLYIGGTGGHGKHRKDTVEEWSRETNTWKKVNNLKLKNGRDVGFSAVVLPGAVLCGFTSGVMGVGGGYGVAVLLTIAAMLML